MTPVATDSTTSVEKADATYGPPEYHNVIAIGAGVTSLALVCQLQTMIGEKDFIVLEREAGVGGTWWSNTYPGAGCDIPIPLYSFSFAQKKDWSSFFALQDEIRAYLENVADRFDVTRKCRFGVEVTTAQWDEKLGLWHVYTRPHNPDLSPRPKHYICRVLFTGLGHLNIPNACDIAGHETFKGPLFHSARWDHSVSLAGKNVFVIGNGCSAAQFVPMIAKEAKMVNQAVRAKHWYAERPHDLFDIAIWRWMVRYLPGFWRMQRWIIALVLEFSMITMFRHRIGTFFRNRFANKCIQYAKKTAPAKYHKAVIPSLDEVVPGCKRRVFDTGYLKSLQRDNVDLVTSAVTEIKENSVISKDGKEYPADVIILANGFAVKDAGFPLKIIGRNNRNLQDYWKGNGGPQTYRSCMLSEFPNFFQGMGTNSGTGHFSFMFTAECLGQYAIRVMEPVLRAPRPYIFDSKAPGVRAGPTVACKPSAEREETIWAQATSYNKMVYGYNCSTWYIDAESGRQTTMYPSWQCMFWMRSAFPLYHRDLVYQRCTPPGGYLTRVREWLNIGGLPKPSQKDVEQFKAGKFTQRPKPKELLGRS
jgi:cation diffusion facilitator CzcD-associated flavoprotein CzcO